MKLSSSLEPNIVGNDKINSHSICRESGAIEDVDVYLDINRNPETDEIKAINRRLKQILFNVHTNSNMEMLLCTHIG